MEIKEYWNQRASTDVNAVTTNDLYLRVLERQVFADKLRQLGCSSDSTVLDLGCGDGQTILHLWHEFGCRGIGVDYSQEMIQLAQNQLRDMECKGRIEFLVGDIRQASDIFTSKQFDFVVTDRSLINLESSDEQYASIQGIAQLVKDNGYYLAVENFEEGNEQLNKLRKLFELPPIPMRWHNHYFKEEEFIREVNLYFRDVQKIDFSSAYYFSTRVIYSKLCQVEGVEPDYAHPIHRLSVDLPIVGDFSPIKLVVMRK